MVPTVSEISATKRAAHFGLPTYIVKIKPITIRSEARDQGGFLTIGDYLRMIGRFVRLFIRDQETRAMMKYATSNPAEYVDYMGYGLYVARRST